MLLQMSPKWTRVDSVDFTFCLGDLVGDLTRSGTAESYSQVCGPLVITDRLNLHRTQRRWFGKASVGVLIEPSPMQIQKGNFEIARADDNFIAEGESRLKLATLT